MEFSKIAFISDFIAEFREKLDILENNIFDFKKNQTDMKLIDSVIIMLHTMKSNSFMMGYRKLESILKQITELFENIKDGRIKLSNDIIRFYIFISEQLRDTLKIIEEGQSDDIKHFDFIEINLKKAIDGEPFSVEFENDENKDLEERESEISNSNQIIRVSVNKLDELLQNFDKLIMREFRLKKLLYELFDVDDKFFSQNNSRKIRQIKETIELIESQSYTIQDSIISMRKLPFEMILQPFKRTAMIEAIKMGKNIYFEIPHTEIKIDKSILERIPVILEKLVINSLEHGIESEKERKAAGKELFGTITISVRQMLNRIILTVSDDGRGIDFEKIRESVIEKYPENENDILALDSKNLIEFIFQPGITTKIQEIDDDREIGLGLVNVRDEIDKIKGKIKIESKEGAGTVIELSMPLSLATQEGLFVKAGSYKLLILTHYIKEILTVKPDCFINIQSDTVIPVRNELIPIYNSKAIFGNNGNDYSKEEVSVIILEYMENKIAVVMDEILNYMTVVIKPLPPIFKNFKVLQGVVFDEDYKIVPIINVPDLIKRFKMLNEYEMKKFEVQNERKNHSVLIVDSSPTTRQIEEDIFETENYTVTTCCDGIEALSKMKEMYFDLIVTDTDMPRMDGIVLIHNIRHMKEYESIPIIVVSSLIDESEKSKFLDIGAQAYISKTNFKRENLIKTAKELVND